MEKYYLYRVLDNEKILFGTFTCKETAESTKLFFESISPKDIFILE